MTHYRVPFFEALREECSARGYELVLAYGNAAGGEIGKRDSGDLAWGRRLPTRYLFGSRLCWQPFGALLRDADLVIMTAENKLLYNLRVQFGPRNARVGLWGHGANLQGNPRSLRERFKRLVAKRADWWFAYTKMSISLIERSGFASERITVLNNAVDTEAIAKALESVTLATTRAFLDRLRLAGGHIGIFVGSIYPDKRIEFMLSAALAVRRRVPDFEFLLVGAGPQQHLVEDFCRTHAWARYLGPLYGAEKVQAIAASQVMINPGLVGLGLLDSFVCRVPLATTDCKLHSPEVAYLEDGVNGLMAVDDLEIYAARTAEVLLDSAFREKLRNGCRESASRYTVANMAKNFVDGIEGCLPR